MFMRISVQYYAINCIDSIMKPLRTMQADSSNKCPESGPEHGRPDSYSGMRVAMRGRWAEWIGAWFCLDTARCRMLVATVECDCCYSHCCCRQQQLQFSSKKPGQSVALEQLTGRPLGPAHNRNTPCRPSIAKNVSWSGFALDTRTMRRMRNQLKRKYFMSHAATDLHICLNL